MATTEKLDEFVFDADSVREFEGGCFIARISGTITSRAELFRQLRNLLKLPAYFGENWDALSDCLRDLSWIQERRVILLHEQLPSLEEDGLRTYLKILSESVRDWQPGEDHELVIVLPKGSRGTVDHILAGRRGT